MASDPVLRFEIDPEHPWLVDVHLDPAAPGVRALTTPGAIQRAARCICMAHGAGPTDALGDPRLHVLPLLGGHPLAYAWRLASGAGPRDVPAPPDWEFNRRLAWALENPSQAPLLQGCLGAPYFDGTDFEQEALRCVTAALGVGAVRAVSRERAVAGPGKKSPWERWGRQAHASLRRLGMRR